MKNRLFFCVLTGFAILQVVFFPKCYISAFFGGLELFYSVLLPVLFPFFFFSGILLKTGVMFDISQKFFSGVARKVGLSGHFPYVFLLAVLSGYPMNAKLASDLMDSGEVGASEGESLAFSTSCSGVLFVYTTVGTCMFGSRAIGWGLLFCHLIACIFGYFLFARFCGGGDVASASGIAKPRGDFNMFSAVTESGASALSSVLLVGAYVCIFAVIARMFETIGVFPENGILGGFCKGLLEITSGVDCISRCDVTPISLALVCSLISFGGISINMQSLGLLIDCGVSAGRFFILKTLQMICGFCIAFAVFSVLGY